MGSKERWGMAIAAAAVVLFGIAGTVSAEFRFPDTGQTKCYQTVEPWAEIPCCGTGQDGAYTINPPSYTDNGNSTVTDNNTGLVWQQVNDGRGPNWYQASGTYDADYNPYSVDVCGDLGLGGASGWRLPTDQELLNIVDYAIPFPGPTIDAHYFPGTASFFYWSSTTGAGRPYDAWVVDFDNGFVFETHKNNEFYVRCVRGGQSGSFDHFIDHGNNTVSDTNTGLTWQQGETEPMNMAAALSYCEGFDLGGEDDWRLPNIKELQSLTDSSRFAPAIDSAYFPNADPSYYWSSTSFASNPSHAWLVDFYNGYVNAYAKDTTFYVRCVRGGQSGSFPPPQAVGDSATTTENTSVTIPVLANDSAPEGSVLAIGSVGAPAHGTALVSGDAILYTPVAGYTGTDRFTYCLAADACICATVTVTIGGPVIAASPNPLRFPNTVAGEASAPRTVTVSNAGSVDLVLGAISGLSGDNLDFEIWSDGCSGQTLPPGDSCAIEVKFKPIFTGAKIAWFAIPSNDPDTRNLDVTLEGEGLAWAGAVTIAYWGTDKFHLAYAATVAGSQEIAIRLVQVSPSGETVLASQSGPGPISFAGNAKSLGGLEPNIDYTFKIVADIPDAGGHVVKTTIGEITDHLDGTVRGELLFDENLEGGGFSEWYIGTLTVSEGRTLTIRNLTLRPSGPDGITVHGTLSLAEGTDGGGLTLELYKPITLTGMENFTLNFHAGSESSTVEGGENLVVSAEPGLLTVNDVEGLWLIVTEQTGRIEVNGGLLAFFDLKGLGGQTDLAFNSSRIGILGPRPSDNRSRSQDAKVVFTGCIVDSGTFVIGPDDLPEMMRMESCEFLIPLEIKGGNTNKPTRPDIKNCTFASEVTLTNRDAAIFEGNKFRREIIFDDEAESPHWADASWTAPLITNNSFLGQYALRYKAGAPPPGPILINSNYYGDRGGSTLLPPALDGRFLTAHGAIVDTAGMANVFTLLPALATGKDWKEREVYPDFWVFGWIVGQNTISHENHGAGAPMVRGRETLLSVDLGTSSDGLNEVTVEAVFGGQTIFPQVRPDALYRDLSYYTRNTGGKITPNAGGSHLYGRSTFNFYLPGRDGSNERLEVFVMYDGVRKSLFSTELRFEDPPPRKLGIQILGTAVLDWLYGTHLSRPDALGALLRVEFPGYLPLREEDLNVGVEPVFWFLDQRGDPFVSPCIAQAKASAAVSSLRKLNEALRSGNEAPVDLIVLNVSPGQLCGGTKVPGLFFSRLSSGVVFVEDDNVSAFVHEMGHIAGLHLNPEQYDIPEYLSTGGRPFPAATAFSPNPDMVLSGKSRFAHLFSGNKESWVDMMGSRSPAWPDLISLPVFNQWLRDTLTIPAPAHTTTSLASLPAAAATRRIFLHAALRPDPESGIYKPRVGGLRAFDLTAVAARGVPPATTGGDPCLLEAFDALGTLVHTEDFHIPGPGEGSDLVYYPWAATFEVPEAAASLKVTRLADGLVYFTAAASNTITNAFLEPAPGTVLGDKVTVRWEAGDVGTEPDPVTGQPLQHLLILSTDGGATWRPVGLPREESEVELSTTSIPAGNRISLRLLTSDGLRTAEARVDGLIVENRPPAAAIQFPVDGSKAVPGTAWTLQATAADPDNDLAGGGTWQSSLDGALGEGLSLQGIVLSPGEHLLSYTAADTAGHTSVAEVHVTVVELPVIDLALAAASLKIYSEARPGQLPVGKEQLAVLGVTNTGTDTTLHLTLYLTPPGGPETLLAEADLSLLPFEHGQVSGRFTTNVEGEYRLRGVIGTTEPPDENEGNNQWTWTFVTVPPAPKIAISPVWRDFEPVAVSQEAVQTFTIANGGTRDLHLGALAFTGTGAGDFALRNDTASNRTVAPGATVMVDVVCRPSFTGHTTAALAVPSDDPDFSTLAIDLTGIGTGEAIITASAGTGGRIDPAGAVSVYLGWDKTFTISPDPGWHVADILVDGASMGAAATYTFLKVMAGHTIAASFAVDPVALLSPNGGEIFPTGSVQTIRWNAPVSAATYTLEYSTDGGGAWEPVADGVTGSSHDWTVPAQPENRPECLVRIIARNAAGAEHSRSTSSAPFRIEVVKVTAPAAGAILTAGRKVCVSWQVNQTMAPVSSILLQYSRNGGETWQKIATLKGSASSFIWTVEAVGPKPDPNCFVRVSLDNHLGRSVGSAESGPFTIQPKRGRPLSNR